jgi:hypothetical protein
MIDEPAYLRELHEFYKDPAAKAASARPWYCQYLLVLAFGKAFLTQKNSSGTPPGHQYASRAMALLPDLSGIDEDPLACIQALSLGAVYLQSIDMRRAAFQHVSSPTIQLKYSSDNGIRLDKPCVVALSRVYTGMYQRKYVDPNSPKGAEQSSGWFIC